MKLVRLQDSSQRTDVHSTKKQAGLSFSTERQAPSEREAALSPWPVRWCL